MIKLGEIRRCYPLRSGLVLCLKLSDPLTQPIRNGDTILIDGTRAVTVKGHKHWPEGTEMDLLVDSTADEPDVGTWVYRR